MHRSWALLLAAVPCAGAVAAIAAAVSATNSPAAFESGTRKPKHKLRGIHKIRHVIVIMQENRSFDSYFGTYPGAHGIPMKNGVPTACVPDPARGTASGRTTTRTT